MTNAFLDRIVQRARAEPNRLFALLHESGSWHPASQGQLLRRAGSFGQLFADAGLKPGEIVFLVLRHGLDCYAAFLGAMLAGGVPSFLPYPNSRQDENFYWRQHAALFARVRPRLILVYDELAAAVEDCVQDFGARVLKQSDADAKGAEFTAVPRHMSDTALLQHSSGTTGLKKGVALSYAAIVCQIEAYQNALAPATGMTIGSWLPLYHDMGLVTGLLMPLSLGTPLVAMDPFVWAGNPRLFLDAICEHGITHAWMPNFAFMHLVRALPRHLSWDLHSLQALINCSEPCKPAAFDTFLARYGPSGITGEALQTCYAMAETVFAVTQSKPGHPPRRIQLDRAALAQGAVVGCDAGDGIALLSNGRVLKGCEVAVLTQNGVPATDRVLGELCIRAEFLFDGYYKNAEATDQAVRGGWYHTGDLGFLDRGEIFVTGRLKDLLIINGKNIFAHDVEAAVAAVEGVKAGRGAALGIYDERLGSEQLVVVAERDGTPEQDSVVMGRINNAVLQETGTACAAVRMTPPGWLIKTTSGKVSRVENLTKYMREFAQEGPNAV